MVLKEVKVFRDLKEVKVFRDLKDLRDLKESKDLRDLKESRVLRVVKENRDLREVKVNRDLTVHNSILDQKLLTTVLEWMEIITFKLNILMGSLLLICMVLKPTVHGTFL